MSDLDLLDDLVTTETAARANALLAEGQKPVAVADEDKTARRLGVPANVVSLAPEELKAQADKKAFDDLIDGNIAVSGYVAADPRNAAVSKNDLAILDKLDRVNGLGPRSAAALQQSFFDDFGTAVKKNYRAHELNQKFFTQHAVGSADREFFERQDEKLRSGRGLSPMAELFGGFLGDMAAAAPTAGLGGAAGLAIAGPPGAVVGIAGGFAVDMLTTTFAQIYRTLDAVRDHQGNAISESVKNTAAIAGGVFAGAAGGAGGHVTGKMISNLATRAATQIVKDSVIQNTMTKALGQVAGSGLQFGALNTGIFLGTSLAEELAKSTTAGDIETIFNDPQRRMDWITDAARSFGHGLLLGGAIGTIPVGTNMLLDRVRITQHSIDINKLNEQRAAATESETAAISPERFADFVDNHSGIKPIRVGVDAVDALRAQGKLQFIAEEVLEPARATGGDVEIRASDYFTKVSDEEHAALLSEIRTDSGLTANEVETLATADYGETPTEVVLPETETINNRMSAQDMLANLDSALQDGPIDVMRFSEPPTTAEIDQLITAGRKYEDAQIDSLFGADAERVKKLARGPNAGKVDDVIFEKFGSYNVPEAKEAQRILFGIDDAPIINIESLRDLRDRLSNLEFAVEDAANGNDGDLVRELAWVAPRLPDIAVEETIHSQDARIAILALSRAFNDMQRLGVDPEPIFRKTVEYTSQRVGGDAADATILLERLSQFSKAVFGDMTPKTGLLQLEGKLEAVEPEQIISSFKQTLINEFQDGQTEWQRALWLGPLFKEPQAAMLDASSFRKYSKAIQEQQARLAKGVFTAAEREIKRRESKLWKENLKIEIDNAEETLARRPDFAADRFLMREDAQFKLSREEVNEIGLSVLDVADLADKLPPKYFTIMRESMPAADIAELAGHSSDVAMLRELLTLAESRRENKLSRQQQFERAVQEEAARVMEEKYGRLDDRVMAEALDAVVSVKQLEVMLDEVKALGGDRGVSVEDVQALIDEKFGELRLDQALDTNGFMRLVQKYGEQAHRALLSEVAGGTAKNPYPVQAFLARQRQMINLGLMQASRRFAREHAKTMKEVKRFSENVKVDNVDQAFTDQIHNLLFQVKQRVPRSLAHLQEALGGVSLRQFVDEQSKNFVEIATNPTVDTLVPLGLFDLGEFSAARFRDFSETLQSLIYHGRRAKQLETDTNKAMLEYTLRDLTSSFDQMPGDWTPKNPDSILRQISAGLLKTETYFDWIDQKNPHGVLNTYVIRPLNKAEFRFLDMTAKVAKSFQKVPKLKRKATAPLENDVLLDPATGKPMALTEDHLRGLILNRGNNSNWQKVLKGMGWDEVDAQAFINRHATAEHAAWANAMFEAVDIWPELRETVREATGVAPEEIQATPFKIKGEKVNGGYYPLIQDFLRTKARMEIDPTGRSFNEMLRTPNAFKNRTGAVYPVDLTTTKLPAVLQDTIRGIAMHIPLREASKVLTSDAFKKGMIAKLGPEFYTKIRPWLEGIRRNGSISDWEGMERIENWLDTARGNIVTLQTGVRLSTAMIHGGSALSNSIGEIGKGNLAKGSVEFLRAFNEMFRADAATGKKWRDFVWENSGEIRNRRHTIERDLQVHLRSALGESKIKAQWRAWSGFLITQLDQLSAEPTWLAVYRQQLGEHGDHELAVDMADKSVRQAHGSNSVTNLAPIQNGGSFAKLLTMFMGYFNHALNREFDIAWEGRKAISEKDWMHAGLQGGRAIAYLLVPALVHEAVRGERKEEEGLGEFFGKAVLGQVAAGLPIVRDIWHQTVTGRTAEISPLVEAFHAAAANKKDIAALFEGTLDDRRWVENTLNTMTVLSGYSSRSINSLTQELWDSASGNARSYDDRDWWRLVLEGKSKPKTR